MLQQAQSSQANGMPLNLNTFHQRLVAAARQGPPNAGGQMPGQLPGLFRSQDVNAAQAAALAGLAGQMQPPGYSQQVRHVARSSLVSSESSAHVSKLHILVDEYFRLFTADAATSTAPETIHAAHFERGCRSRSRHGWSAAATAAAGRRQWLPRASVCRTCGC